jgi:hypothetical protein
MTYVTFEDYTPIPRFDATPWTRIRIEESAAAAGPWTILETQDLDPLDLDPAHPATRAFSTGNATLEHGWYKVSFLDAAGNILPTSPIQNTRDLEWRPGLHQVGAIAMARTRDSMGNETGTFTADTRPTDDQVQRLIDQAVNDIRDEIGIDVPDDLVEKAQQLTALRAVMYIELTYFANEVAQQKSAYPQIRELFKEALPRLQRAIDREEMGGDPADETSGNHPFYSFPAAIDMLEGKL